MHNNGHHKRHGTGKHETALNDMDDVLILPPGIKKLHGSGVAKRTLFTMLHNQMMHLLLVMNPTLSESVEGAVHPINEQGQAHPSLSLNQPS